jgi:hypothetical protein
MRHNIAHVDFADCQGVGIRLDGTDIKSFSGLRVEVVGSTVVELDFEMVVGKAPESLRWSYRL